MPPGVGQALEPGGDVDAVAEDVVVLDDHVAEIDADPELDPAGRRHVGVALGHPALDLGGALDGLDDARELDQHAIAAGLDDPALVLGDRGIDQLEPVRPQARERARFVRLHEPAVAHHVGGEDHGEPALDGVDFHSLLSLGASAGV